MKKIILVAGVLLFWGAGVSFAADSCQQQLDVASNAFFQHQAKDRAVFISGHQSLIAQSDASGKEWAAYNAAKRHAMLTGDNSKMPSTPPATIDDSALSAFASGQHSEEVTFLAKLDQAKRDNCTSIPAVPTS